MSWSPLLNSQPPKDTRAAPVRMAANLGMRGANPSILIIVRPGELEGLGWWKADAQVKVEVGHGEHEGMLRVTPGAGGFSLRKTPGVTAGKGSVLLRLRHLPAWKPSAQKPRPVEYDWSDGWLIVTLPDWARPQRPVTGTTATPTAPAPARKPFKVGAKDGLADKHVPNGGLPNGGLPR